MTEIPIAYVARAFNSAASFSTTVERRSTDRKKPRRSPGRPKKQRPKPHGLTVDDWPRIADEIASWYGPERSLFLEKERAIKIIRQVDLSGLAWWVMTWWLDALNRQTGSDWHGLDFIAKERQTDLRSIRSAVRQLEAHGFVLRRKKQSSGFRRRGQHDQWETTFPVLVKAAKELRDENAFRNKNAVARDQDPRSGILMRASGNKNAHDSGIFIPPNPTSTEPSEVTPQRAGAREFGAVSDCDLEVRTNPGRGDITSEVLAKALELCPGRDVHELHRDWKDWSDAQDEPVANPAAAFLAFCRKKGPLKGSGFKSSADPGKPLPAWLKPAPGEVAIGRGSLAWDRWLYWADVHDPAAAKLMRSSKVFTIFAPTQTPAQGCKAPRIPHPAHFAQSTGASA